MSDPVGLLTSLPDFHVVHPHPDRLCRRGRQPDPDLVARGAWAAGRPGPPGPVHPQVVVQGPRPALVEQAGEHVLADDVSPENLHPTQVDGREPRHAQICSHECPAGQGRVEPPGGAANSVPLGHGPIVTHRRRSGHRGPNDWSQPPGHRT